MSVVAQSVGLQKNEGAARMQGMHNAEKNKNYIICQCHEFGRHIALFKGETGAILGRMKSGSIQDLAVRLCCRNFDCVHPAACTLFLVSALRQRAIFREILEAELKTRGRKGGRKEGRRVKTTPSTAATITTTSKFLKWLRPPTFFIATSFLRLIASSWRAWRAPPEPT